MNTACGFGGLAFHALASSVSRAAATAYPSVARPHFVPRAKRVIFLFMHGGVSQVDSFDHKPRLAADDGKPLPFKGLDNLDATKNGGGGKVMRSPWAFRQAGESGNWVSDLWPEVSKHIDDLCFIKSMHTQGTSHGQAVSMIHTGTDNLVRPSMGSWVSYGLGAENADLPGFISVAPPRGHGGIRNYGSAFLPAQHQATAIGHSGMNAKDAAIRYLKGADGEGADGRMRRQLALLREMNEEHFGATKDPQIEGVIESYDLAYRMQGVAPGLMDIGAEPESVRELYGIGDGKTEDFGRRCLLARRFSEAGVRFVQASTPYVWDQHGGLKEGHQKNALAVDRPISGLLTDLKQRGMLDDTLVVWGTEFGRTPVAQGSNGRDHNPAGFTVWMAGGGVKAGYAHGETDEFGYFAVKDKVHMHDLHATILHLLGIDHERLTYRYAGRDFRLTDVYGSVVREVLA